MPWRPARWLAAAGALRLAAAAAGGLAPGALGALADAEPAPAVVVVVRHAEKAADGTRDPPLSEAGLRRSADLARLLAHAGVTHLYATNLRRTRQTLAPLAEATGLAVVEVAADRTEEQVRLLRALPAGAVAVVAGHSDTVPAIVRGLGGSLVGASRTEHGEALAGDDYDRLFVVILPGKGPGAAAVQTLELRYGAAGDRAGP